MSTGSSNFVPGIGNEVLIAFTLGIGLILFGTLKVIYQTSNMNQDGVALPALLRQAGLNDDCSICLQPLRFAVETNCGHMYCASCIFQLQEHQDLTNPFIASNCPYCRQRITMLIPSFTQEEQDTVEQGVVEERLYVQEEIMAFNRRFSNIPRSIAEQVRDMPAFLRHLYRCLSVGRGLTTYFKIRMFIFVCLGLLYLFLPTDLMPEIILGPLGFIDDFFFFFVMVNCLANIYRANLAEDR